MTCQDPGGGRVRRPGSVGVVVQVAGVFQPGRGCPDPASVRQLRDGPAVALLEQMVPLAVQAAVAAACGAFWPRDPVLPFAAPGVAGADGQGAFPVPDLDQCP